MCNSLVVAVNTSNHRFYYLNFYLLILSIVSNSNKINDKRTKYISKIIYIILFIYNRYNRIYI